MGLRQIWNWLLGVGTLFSFACLFFVKYSDRSSSTGQPRTLVNAMAELAAAEDGVQALISLVGGLLILGTVCLPPILWYELARAVHPLSGRMRALLIGQGVLALAGTAVTTLAMALTLGTPCPPAIGSSSPSRCLCRWPASARGCLPGDEPRRQRSKRPRRTIPLWATQPLARGGAAPGTTRAR